jgi:hypothetical protein
MGEFGDSSCLNVSSMKAAPRRASPSEAIEVIRSLVLSCALSTPLITVWTIFACSIPVSFLQSPETRTGRPG